MQLYKVNLFLFFISFQFCFGYYSPRIAYLEKEPWIGLKTEFPEQIQNLLKQKISEKSFFNISSQEDLYKEEIKNLFTKNYIDLEQVAKILLDCDKMNLVIPFWGKDFNFLKILEMLNNSEQYEKFCLGHVITPLEEYITYTRERLKDIKELLEEH